MAATGNIELEPGWLAQLEDEFSSPYMQSLKAFLLAQKQAGLQRLHVGA